MTEQFTTPSAIEGESMRIIAQELESMGIAVPEKEAPVLHRVIHTTADFEYASNLVFSPNAVERGIAALKNGTPIVTDTNMALSGINRQGRERLGVDGICYMADSAVAEQAKANGTTRAVAAVDVAAERYPNAIFAVGNAPTALIRMHQLILAGKLHPALIIGVPVGFVNVVESKQQIWRLAQELDIPAIVALGRKGGSTVAAAICNALIYQSGGRG